MGLMIIPTFVNFTVAFTPIVQLILGAGTITTFMVAYLIFGGIREFGPIKWEAVLMSVIASVAFAAIVLSFVNILFNIMILVAFSMSASLVAYVFFWRDEGAV